MRVAVIGAGVIGLTTAVAVKSAFPNFQVTIFSDKFTPNTTGDGSAGLWSPYILNDTPVENILRWSGETYRWLEALWKGGLAAETGISLIPIYRLTQHPQGYSRPPWTQMVHGSRELTKEELIKFNKEFERNYTGGWHFIAYTCEPMYLLPWLMKRFIKMGGVIVNEKILTINELCDKDFAIVINCTGLGAKELAKDFDIVPVRGQVIRVRAPWIMHVIIEDDDDGNYMIPNIGCTVLGGTHQNDDNCSVNREDSIFIYKGCYRLSPALKESTTIKEWVGLRPGRKTVRLESEFIQTSKGVESMIIHNYGHGGSGVTLCWGCALNVVGIIKNLKFRVLDSKL